MSIPKSGQKSTKVNQANNSFQQELGDNLGDIKKLTKQIVKGTPVTLLKAAKKDKNWKGYEILPKDNQKELYDMANIHREASTIGLKYTDQKELEKYLKKNPEVKDITCDCCGRKNVKKQLNLSCAPSELQFLGAGYPLFFEFMKFSAYFLIIILLAAGSYNLLTNTTMGGSCVETDKTGKVIVKPGEKAPPSDLGTFCVSTWITNMSLINKSDRNGLNHLQEILNLSAIIVLSLFIQYFRYVQREVGVQCDTGDISAADYTAQLFNLPTNLYKEDLENLSDNIKKQIEETYNKYPKEQNPETEDDENSNKKSPVIVTCVNIAYDQKDLTKYYEERDQKVADYQVELDREYSGEEWRQTKPKFLIFGSNPVPTKEEMKKAIDESNKLIQTEKTNVENKTFAGTCFVSFETEQDKDRVIDASSKTFPEFIIEKCFGIQEEQQAFVFKYKDDKQVEQSAKITIKQAPEPSDVYWPNLTPDKFKQVLRQIVSILIILISLYACLWTISKISIWQDHFMSKHGSESTAPVNPTATTPATTQSTTTAAVHTNFLFSHKHLDVSTVSAAGATASASVAPSETIQVDQFMVKGISKLMGILVPLLNFILTKIIMATTNFEKTATKSEYNSSLAIKLSIAMFINSSIVQFIIKVFNPWVDKNFVSARSAIFDPVGLVINQNSVFINLAFVSVAIYIVDQTFIMAWGWKWLQERKRDQQKSVLTRDQMNAIYAYPEYDIAPRYAFLISMLFSCAFYAPLIPMAMVYTLIGIFLMYWCEKFIILRRRSVSTYLSEELSIDITDMLQWFLFIFCCSNFIFDILVVDSYAENLKTIAFGPDLFHAIYHILKNDEYKKYVILGFLISLGQIILPMQKINEILIPTSADVANTAKYHEVRENFEDQVYHKKNKSDDGKLYLENKK